MDTTGHPLDKTTPSPGQTWLGFFVAAIAQVWKRILLCFRQSSGVTCLRPMLEYCQTENRYFERPVGHIPPNMLRLWDDLFLLCERYGLRILLTPFDTFWMRRRWSKHPYNRANGGPCSRKNQWLRCPRTILAIKERFAFVVRRWGGSGALFAWDLWNDLIPCMYLSNQLPALFEWVTEISMFVRTLDMETLGRAHLQTVSIYGPLFKNTRSE